MNAQPENQFDFWLGEWDIHWGENNHATNLVEKILDGKVIQENFMAPDLKGISVSCYDPERSLWCQTWVDNNGTYLDFTGKFEDNKMIFQTNPFAFSKDTLAIRRMTFFNLGPDKVRQFGEISKDNGKVWVAEFDLEYRRRK